MYAVIKLGNPESSLDSEDLLIMEFSNRAYAISFAAKCRRQCGGDYIIRYRPERAL